MSFSWLGLDLRWLGHILVFQGWAELREESRFWLYKHRPNKRGKERIHESFLVQEKLLREGLIINDSRGKLFLFTLISTLHIRSYSQRGLQNTYVKPYECIVCVIVDIWDSLNMYFFGVGVREIKPMALKMLRKWSPTEPHPWPRQTPTLSSVFLSYFLNCSVQTNRLHSLI